MNPLDIITFSVPLIQIPLVLLIIVLLNRARKQIFGIKWLAFGFIFNLIYLFYFILVESKSPIYVLLSKSQYLIDVLEANYHPNFFSLATSFCFYVAGINLFIANNSNYKDNNICKSIKYVTVVIILSIAIFLYIINPDPQKTIPESKFAIFYEFLPLILIASFFIYTKIEHLGKKYIAAGFILWGIANLDVIITKGQFADDTLVVVGFISSFIAKFLIIFGIFIWYINIEKISATIIEREVQNRESIEKLTKALESILNRTFHELILPLTSLEATIKEMPNYIPRDHRNKIEELESYSERVQAIVESARNNYTKKLHLQENDPSINDQMGLDVLHFEIIKINSLIESAVMSVKHSLKGIQFSFQYGGNCYIDCNHNAIIQVFSNLFKNAYEAYDLHENKLIHIKTYIVVDTTTEQRKKFVVAEIEDFAKGIKISDIDKIWLESYSTKEKNESHIDRGQGLFIVKKILSRHHGSTITVKSSAKEENEKVKHGTIFVLEFPHVTKNK